LLRVDYRLNHHIVRAWLAPLDVDGIEALVAG
jgi:hypothetical protein